MQQNKIKYVLQFIKNHSLKNHEILKIMFDEKHNIKIKF
jgi:hypothetical protein